MRERNTRRGGTLTELMVAVAVLSIGVLGLFGAFRFIARTTLISRATSLATNLGQERIESLKNLNYYALQITTATGTDSTVEPHVLYDTVNYPPETIAIGGITFTRYTYVSMAELSGSDIDEVSATYPDTGLKQITTHIIWSEAGRKKVWSLRNLLENPNINPLDSTITGTVRNSAGGTVASAVVVVEQNEDWGAAADGSGVFSFSVYHGTYTLRASSHSFTDAVSTSVVASRSAIAVRDLTLTSVPTGYISGNVWFNSGLVISQVVAETTTWTGGDLVRNVEYIELFNPTTYPINIGTTGDPEIRVDYDCEAAGFDKSHDDFNFVFMTTYVPARHHYLLASATAFMIDGAAVNADACFGVAPNCDTAPTIPDYLDSARAGGLRLRRYSDNAYYDSVGWDDNNNIASADPGIAEGTSIPNYTAAGRDGLEAGNQIVRVSSPGASVAAMWTYGRAYDSNDNSRDFLYPSGVFDGIVYSPRNTSNSERPTITGKTAVGAYVSVSDPNSGSTIAYVAYVTSGSLSLPYARFALPGVATGTWSAAAAYGSYAAFIDSVTVSQNAYTGLPNADTTPSWAGANLHHIVLTDSMVSGFVKGVVTDSAGAPINGITVQGGGSSKVTGSNGVYFMPVSSGTITLVANPNNLVSTYVQGVETPSVTEGAVTTQNFTLPLGGRITGYVTTGTTPLAYQPIAATSGGSQSGAGVTDTGGNFTIRNVSTGTHTVFPVLESGQDVTPNTIDVILTSAGGVFAGTFTVSGAFGNIAGTISDAAGLVTSGALLLASTSTIASSPSAIVASSAPAQLPMYMVSSKADGSYTLPVRGGASPYYLSVYVPVISAAGGVSITTKTYSGIVVSPSSTTVKYVTIP
ncbi:MAG: carboxypeptidase regulatory-like domain-containing protein [Elusimicrobia bacterium]|nr:carboxypeptidase regulatory-like domain-containing protein [Elusimicrobiota bacterium]